MNAGMSGAIGRAALIPASDAASFCTGSVCMADGGMNA